MLSTPPIGLPNLDPHGQLARVSRGSLPDVTGHRMLPAVAFIVALLALFVVCAFAWVR